MTLTTLCALALPLCRMGADPRIRRAVAALAGMDAGMRTPPAYEPLVREMGRHAPDAAEAVALLGGCGTDVQAVSQCFDQEALAFFHLCGQCGAGELLAALTRCAAAPTARGLALLVSRERRQEAMARYGLQLLWRLCGDAALPDALALFPEETEEKSADEVIGRLTRHLKGGDADG